jgi:hypothetical protein
LPDLEEARRFDDHPVYWLGERFEDWPLVHVSAGQSDYVLLVYGRCDIEDPDGILGPEGGSCSPPLQLQIQPLCAHIEAVARSRKWKQRRIRGAPVGAFDGAPVLFTNRVQVKVYRGQGSDPDAPLRALRALRSLNEVAPVLGPEDPIPAPPAGMLEQTRPCSPPR